MFATDYTTGAKPSDSNSETAGMRMDFLDQISVGRDACGK